MKTPGQVADEAMKTHGHTSDAYGYSYAYCMRPVTARRIAVEAIEADRAQRDTDWTGTRPVLMRKGDIVVTGTRMGPWGGVSVYDPEKIMGLPNTLPSGRYTGDYRPRTGHAELPDSDWAELGWTVTETR